MRFAEVVLRVGASIGGWMIFIGYALTVAVLPLAECDPTSDTLWRGTLMLAGLSGLGLGFTGGGLPWKESLRWLAALGIALAVWAAFEISPTLRGTTIAAQSLCSSINSISSTTALTARPAEHTATLIERLWSPLQLCVLTGGVWQGLRYWRPGPKGPRPEGPVG